MLRQQFASPFTDLALLRVAGAPSPATAEGRALLEDVARAILATPGVQGVVSYLDDGDARFVGQDGSPVVVVGLGAQEKAGDAAMLGLRAATDALRSRLDRRWAGVRFRWTGEAAVNADIRRVSSAETNAAELRVLPATLLLLLIAFRSVVAALLPVLCGALTLLVTLGLAAVMNRVWPASVILVSVVTMVGLGLSIDYALLIVSRHREALDQGLPWREAAARALERGGRTTVISGAAVAIGFAAMLLVPVSEVRSIGAGGLLVTVVAVLVATTLLPLVLAALGSWIDFGRRRRPATSGLAWRRWADWIVRHPARVLVVAAVPLMLLASQAARLRIDLPRGDWLPANVESVRVLSELESVGLGTIGQTVRVIVELPTGTRVDSEPGWRALTQLADFLAADPRLARVLAVTALKGGELTGPATVELLAEPVRRSLVSIDGEAALVELLPREGLRASDVTALVRELRTLDPATLSGLAGTRLLVGGVPGFNADYEDAIARSLPRVVLGVIAATLLALAFAFRSVLIPLKAVVLNLLSVTAAFGAVVLVFQDGLGSSLLGLAQPLDGGFPILPVLVFCTVFGLSMDYEVFLVARVAEGHRAGLAPGAALAEALAGTGRLITLAAAIMVVIFAGFMLGHFILIKMLGFALGVAVLLDATVVRLALGPALIHLAGRWNWWPGERLHATGTAATDAKVP